MTDRTRKAERHREGYPHLNGLDYVEFYVGNAKQAAHYFRTAFGFEPMAYAGLETGELTRTSFVMRQHHIHLVLTSSLVPESEIAAHVLRHSDSIKDIAFSVDNVCESFEAAVERGAMPVIEPTRIDDETSCITKATVAVYGDTVHSFIQREGECDAFLPGYLAITDAPRGLLIGLNTIDHIAISLEPGKLDHWVEYYQNVLGFHQSHQEDVATEYSAMRSKVVQNGAGSIVFPLMEPAKGRRRSQIEEYLAFHRSPGPQHLAFATDNIIESVRALRANGVKFLRTPDIYYERLKERVGSISVDMTALCELGILVDSDKWGYLMQISTEHVQSRPTLFVEIIQRQMARGFGAGNIKALFEAMEREQAWRGTVL